MFKPHNAKTHGNGLYKGHIRWYKTKLKNGPKITVWPLFQSFRSFYRHSLLSTVMHQLRRGKPGFQCITNVFNFKHNVINSTFEMQTCFRQSHNSMNRLSQFLKAVHTTWHISIPVLCFNIHMLIGLNKCEKILCTYYSWY